MIKDLPDRTVSATVIKLALAVLDGKPVPAVPGAILEDVRRFSRLCGLECLVAKALDELGDEEAGRVFQGCVTKSMLFQRDLMMLDSILTKMSCPGAVLLKGGSLKYQVYPDPALRPSVDIDILVPSREINRLIRGFLARGFEIEEEPIIKRPVSGRLGYHVGIRHRNLNLLIEVHRGLTQQLRYAHPVELFIEESRQISWLDNIRAPSLQWQLVHGAIHMAQRGFKQAFKHLLDIHILKKRLGGRGIQRATELAALCGARRALSLTMEAADIAFDHKKSPWSWLFSDTGPEVLKPGLPVVPAQLMTGLLTTDSFGQFMHALVIKGSLLPLDVFLQKILQGAGRAK